MLGRGKWSWFAARLVLEYNLNQLLLGRVVVTQTRAVLYEAKASGGTWVRVVQGDITREPVDAIVNAANSHLSHGGGVAGAIARAGGPEIQRQSDEWVRQHGPVPTGSAAITGGGRLRCRHVIHAVGPVWQGRGDEDSVLASAGRLALERAGACGAKTVSLPAISTGIFGFPKERGARIILQAVLEATRQGELEAVNLTNIDAATAATCAAVARELLVECQ
jgi:putative ATPase